MLTNTSQARMLPHLPPTPKALNCVVAFGRPWLSPCGAFWSPSPFDRPVFVEWPLCYSEHPLPVNRVLTLCLVIQWRWRGVRVRCSLTARTRIFRTCWTVRHHTRCATDVAVFLLLGLMGNVLDDLSFAAHIGMLCVRTLTTVITVIYICVSRKTSRS